MAKVTSKLRLTIPKLIADQFGIKPGDQVEWVAAGDAIRVIPVNPRRGRTQLRSVEERLSLFRKMLKRQREREAHRRISAPAAPR